LVVGFINEAQTKAQSKRKGHGVNKNEFGLRKKLQDLLNSCSRENWSDTPDFILANYLMRCLINYEDSVNDREKWYGRKDHDNDTNGGGA